MKRNDFANLNPAGFRRNGIVIRFAGFCPGNAHTWVEGPSRRPETTWPCSQLQVEVTSSAADLRHLPEIVPGLRATRTAT